MKRGSGPKVVPRSPPIESRCSLCVGYTLVALAACSWGTWPLILRAAERIAPMSAAFESSILMFVVACVSGPLVFRDRVRRKATFPEWLGVAWLGVADALNDYFFFAAYQKTSVAIAVLSHYLAPLFVALSAPLVLGERPSRAHVRGGRDRLRRARPPPRAVDARARPTGRSPAPSSAPRARCSTPRTSSRTSASPAHSPPAS